MISGCKAFGCQTHLCTGKWKVTVFKMCNNQEGPLVFFLKQVYCCRIANLTAVADEVNQCNVSI